MIKKIINLSICFIISLCLLSGAYPVCAADSAAYTNVAWEQKNDILYINGTGDMVIDFEYITEIPWYSIRNEISKIVIGDGITSICDSAFADFRLVKEVVLPNSLRVIGPAAFITCTNLQTLVLPYKITRIEDGAFVNCTSLNSIVIPGSIIEIADDAFYNCNNVSILGIGGTYTEKYAEQKNIAFSGSLSPSSEILVRLNDEYIDFDQPPVIVNDRTLVPLRAIFEAMGADVNWDAKTRTVTASRNNITIKMTVDTNIIRRTNSGITTDIEIDVPAQIIGDRTMVPARAIVESFLASVNWDGKTRTVLIQD